MSEQSVLISGGNGYLGLRLAESLLRSTPYQVQLFVHAADDEQLKSKREEIVNRFASASSNGSEIDLSRLKIIGGELASDEPFSGALRKGLKQIIHSAAVTRFNVEEELANQVNIQGSKKLLDFASGCPDLEVVQFLSTVYASGLRTGVVEEVVLDRATAFSNHYERSKWESEQLLREKYSGIPVNIVRIATLIADDVSGVVSQQNAFHNTLKLFYYGLLSLFPGEKETPVYFVTGDFVLESIMSIVGAKTAGEIYHVCHQASETARLEQLVDTVFSTFESYPDFKSRRVLRPLWSDAESFDLLNAGIGGVSSGVMAQAVSSVAPFSRQLFCPKDFRNDKLRALLPSYKAPDPLKLIESTARHLADTKWGRLLQNAK